MSATTSTGTGSDTAPLHLSRILQACKLLRLPAIAAHAATLADQAAREHQSHLAYLDALFALDSSTIETTAKVTVS